LKQEQSKVANFEREQALQNERAGYTTIQWPSENLVNSREHEERFAPGGSSNIESTYRTVIPIELDQVENLSGYDEDAVKRLLSGIGLYSPLGQPEPIVEATLDFMAKHYLSHLFSDPAIVYGTNLPIHTVVIDRS